MRPLSSIFVLVSFALGAAPAPANADHGAHFPDVIQLPAGFRPEGITAGRGDTLYVANFDHGAIFVADARRGTGRILVPEQPGRMGLGLKLDDRTGFLVVCGGSTGHAYVYDARTGQSIADYVLQAAGPTFINDVILTRDAAYFTDSFRPVFYRLPLGRGGRLPPQSAVREIPLAGDYEFNAAPGAFNANGIELAPEGRDLIIVNSNTGKLYRLEPSSGVTAQIDLGGVTLPTGDGLVLRGHTLYVVQNTNNIAVVALSHHARRGRVVANITNPDFDTLATATFLGGDLYVTNARFQIQDPTGQRFSVVRVPIED